MVTLSEQELTLSRHAPLTRALNLDDEATLLTLFQPTHPLADIEPLLQDDPAWQELTHEWVADLVLHGQEGEWHYRGAHALGQQEAVRLEYRLVHEDFSVEYFYFDTEPGTPLVITDMGNRLFQLSQVALMAQLYQRMLIKHTVGDEEFAHFFSLLAPYNRGELTSDEMVSVYAQLSAEMQDNVLVRDLLLRALMSEGAYWYWRMPETLRETLLQSDYALLEATFCLQQDEERCDGRYAQLDPDLQQDVALQTEMGIRALERNEVARAEQFSRSALTAEPSFFPTYWLQMQLGIVNGDHSQALAGLDKLVQEFDVPINKQMLTQLYPNQGQAFLKSAQFRQWAEQFPEE
ncbi:tetratricopeptide repeat protein [Ferrimonas marina]|nr:hypothetical protein [Ferrimonas marina]